MSKYWEWNGHKVSWTVENEKQNSKFATILIHGFGACKEHWRYNQKVISKITPCYAIDLIGFDWS